MNISPKHFNFRVFILRLNTVWTYTVAAYTNAELVGLFILLIKLLTIAHIYVTVTWRNILSYLLYCRDDVVGTANCYVLNGPRIESRWGRDFPHPSRPALEPNQPPVQWVPGLSRAWSGRGVALTTYPHLAPSLKKSEAMPLPPFYAFMAGYGVTFPFTFSLCWWMFLRLLFSKLFKAVRIPWIEL
jgi:hypothetical protein